MKRIFLLSIIVLIHLISTNAKIGDVSDRIIPHIYGAPEVLQSTVTLSTLSMRFSPDSLSLNPQPEAGVKVFDSLDLLQDSVGLSSNNECEIDFSAYKAGNYDLYFVRNNTEHYIGYVEVLFVPNL